MMKERLFHTDNRFWQAVGTVGDLILLSLLTLLCCIPVVTAGAALCALSYVSFRILECGNENTVRNYFHSFRQNLRQGIGITVFLAAFGWILFIDIRIMRLLTVAGTIGYGARLGGWAVCIFLALVYAVFALYLFPLQARFDNPLFVTMKNAFLCGVGNLPKTLLMAAGDLLCAAALGFLFREAPGVFLVPALIAVPGLFCFHAAVLKDLLRLEPGKGNRPLPDGE